MTPHPASTPSSASPSGFSGPRRPPTHTRTHTNHLPSSGVCWPFQPSSLLPPPSLLHLSQTDPTSSQEGKACGAGGRLHTSPELPPSGAHSGSTWIHNLFTLGCSVLTRLRHHHDQTRSGPVISSAEREQGRGSGWQARRFRPENRTLENGHLVPVQIRVSRDPHLVCCCSRLFCCHV